MVKFMKSKSHTLPAGQFKAQCLQLMDEVNEKHICIIITKHGKAVARLVPIEEQTEESFGCLRGTLTIQGDIVAPLNVEWEANK